MTENNPAPQQPKKTSSVRHTRAIQRDRSKRPPAAPPDEQVTQRLTELIRPATFSTVALYYDLGLRERILTLPLIKVDPFVKTQKGSKLRCELLLPFRDS
jgi:hypothetical protein